MDLDLPEVECSHHYCYKYTRGCPTVTIHVILYCCVLASWMYYIIWIQCWRRAPIHSYESCSVTHEAKNDRLPGSKQGVSIEERKRNHGGMTHAQENLACT